LEISPTPDRCRQALKYSPGGTTLLPKSLESLPQTFEAAVGLNRSAVEGP
jgi:hypothetical protein